MGFRIVSPPFGLFLVSIPDRGHDRRRPEIVFVPPQDGDTVLGFVINESRSIPIAAICHHLKIKARDNFELPVLHGGPDIQDDGFIIFRSDIYKCSEPFCVVNNLTITKSIDVFKDCAKGKGPDEAIFVIGAYKWTFDEFQRNLNSNAWLTCELDPDIIFDPDNSRKLSMAMSMIGVRGSSISSQTGHA